MPKKGALDYYAGSNLPGNRTAKVASKALYIASKVARALNVERKYHDLSGQTTPALASPSIEVLNAIAQGDTGSTRDGDQCKILSIQNRMTVKNNSANSMYYRVIFILDKQGDSALPTLADVFETTTTPLSPLQMDNSRRYKVLKDFSGLLAPSGLDGDTKQIKFYHKFSDKACPKVRYSGSTGVVASIASNPIYMIVWPYSSTAATENHYIRVRYVDN